MSILLLLRLLQIQDQTPVQLKFGNNEFKAATQINFSLQLTVFNALVPFA